MRSFLTARWSELIGALTLLTRLPVGNWTSAHPPPAACVWAYPLVGAIVGGIEATTFLTTINIGGQSLVAAVLAIAAATATTGGLHEDGLADTVDGLGGGRTRDQKLAIMRDSRIGTYGTLALALTLMLRVAVVATSQKPVTAILVSEIDSRAAMLLPLLLLSPARPHGLGQSLMAATASRMAIALILAVLTAAVAPWPLLTATAAAALVTLGAQRYLGGYTGDILGAAQQTALCAAFLALES